jgi:hypothetical protein
VSDPLRLSDDVDPALAQLLRAGQKEMPPRLAVEKTIASLGAATTLIGASHAAAAAVSAGKLGIWTLAGWVGAGVLSGVVTMGGVELVQRGVASNPGRRAAIASTAPEAPRHAIEPGPSARAFPAVPGATVAEPALAPPEPLRPATDHAATLRPAVRAAPLRRSETDDSGVDPTISLEIELIDAARSALRAGRAASALEALNRYFAEVKRPRLGPEARYLQMEALFASGNGAAARAAAQRLLEGSPKSPHAARARSILGTP